jgi:hypothetical protein
MGLRAVVLLVCLVGVPLFAVFGKNAPDVVKALIKDYSGGPVASQSPEAPLGEAGAFRPGLVATQRPAPDNTAGAAPSDPNASAPRPLVAVADVAPAANAGTAAQANTFSATAERSKLAAQPPSGPVVRPVAGSIDQRAPGVAAALHTDAPRAAGPAPTVEQPPRDLSAARKSDSGFPSDYFRGAEQRLRQLGATYYLLETLGSSGDNYRFFCKVALGQGQNSNEALAFFATNADPLAAMEDVVRQVEAWRTHLRQ